MPRETETSTEARMLTAVAALIGIVVGAVAAAVLLIGLSRSRVRTAEAERGRILADTEREADSIRREAEIEAEVQGRRLEIVKIEERVSQKEGEIDEKLVDLERKEQGLGDREVHVRALQDELRETQRDALAALERISGLTVHEARQQLLERSKDLV